MADLRERLQLGLVDRYRLERELGRGGMATVYLAHDLRHDRPVALKVLHPELAATLGPERFQREIRMAARLQHPHILTVHDSGETAGQLWYTMPFVEGESLRDRLRRERQLPIADALQITREVADALGYAHTQGLIHRDVKPENVLLTRGHALLADFGVARALQSAGGEQLTQTGTSVGTPAYMSPEQAMGDSALDSRSDLYSLGCVLYEMLTGEAPYTGPSAQAITAKRLMDPVPSARRLRETVPLAIDEALQRALAKSPADRFSTAEAFVQVLSHPSSSGAAPTQVVVKAHAFSPAAPSHRRWGRAVFAGAVLMAAMLGALLWQRAHGGRLVSSANASGSNRLAVLPFENLGDSADAYFADGVTDAVRDKLATLPKLEVIASTSSNQYRRTTKRPEEIGRELGAHYLLVGNVRWAKAAGGVSRVQVRPELVDAQSGAERWGEPFDAPLTDVFQVQADIAARVAQQLQLRLTSAVEQALSERPTKNLEAYEAYLRAEEYVRAVPGAGQDLAQAAYKEAITRDSTFALAWTGLAWTYLGQYRASPSPALAKTLREIIDKALALAPDLADAHARDGEYQTFVLHNNEKALTAYTAGLQLAPNNALLLDRIGWAEMRLGHWKAAATHLHRAAQLDPRSFPRVSDLSFVYRMLRQYGEARANADRALALNPNHRGLITRRIGVYLSEGDVAGAQALLRHLSGAVSIPLLLADESWLSYTWLLDKEQLKSSTSASISAFGRDSAQRLLMLTEVYRRLGDLPRATAYADSARAAYELAVRSTPADAGLHSKFGLALAYLGRHDRAIEEGRRATSLLPVRLDAVAGAGLEETLARIYVLVGEHEEGVKVLKRLLSMPGPLSRNRLRVDESFAALRGNSQFERLVNGR